MSRRHFDSLAVLAILIIIVTSSCAHRSGGDSEASNALPTPDKAAETQTTTAKKILENNKEDKGDFIVEHSAVIRSHHFKIAQQIVDEKLLEKAADKLNRSLILPNDIYLRTKDCDGEVNAFYNADERSVNICYELTEHFYNVFRRDGLNDEKAFDKMFDAVRFALLHEIGHALIDVYNLPISVNEEDAADRCSAFINLTELGEDGVNAVVAAAEAFSIESKNDSSNKRNLADEHLLQEQRFYNSICLLYGSDAEKYGYMLEENYLPRERALRCPQEYERNVNSWSSLLAPWRKS
ncbi:MAG: DUF4344 domain-containing metallopeptidase [Acidobacteriota bacterium]|nr:DUF4344 domain-containing metallopeptidase [Acidobacteriota bacterium]